MVDQIIRPADLPSRASPNASEKIPVDNGSNVAGATVESIVLAGRPTASQAEAEAGTDAVKAMTPLTVDQKIEYEIGRSIASKAQGDKADSAIQEIVAGANTIVDNADPQRPIISSSGNPPAGFKSDIVVVDGQTDWRVARNYKTVSDLLADDGSGDMGMGYAGSGANVIVDAGQIITAQGFRYEVAASDAADVHVETAGGVKLYVMGGDLSISAFALVADGIADDTDQLEKALLTANSRNGRLSGEQGARYRVTRPINIDRTGKVNLAIDWNGSEIFLDEGSLSFNGPPRYKREILSDDLPAGSNFVPLSDVSGIDIGDRVEIFSPALAVHAVQAQHNYIVRRVDSDGVMIDGVTVCDITQQQIIDTGKVGDITIDFFKLCHGLRIRNGKFDVVDTPGSNISLHIDGHFKPIVDNCDFDGHTRWHIYVIGGSHDITQNCTFRRAGYLSPTGELNWPGAPDGLGFGYAVAHSRNYKSFVFNCHAFNCANLSDDARGQMFSTYQNCSGSDCYNVFGTHEVSWNVEWINCEVNGGNGGFGAARCVNARIKDCVVRGASRAIETSKLLTSFEIAGLVYHSPFTWETSASILFETGTLPLAGAVSAGVTPLRVLENSHFIGGGSVSFGGPPNADLFIDSNRLQGGAYFSISLPKFFSITRNVSKDTGGNSPYVLMLPMEGAGALKGNLFIGQARQPNGGMFRVTYPTGGNNIQMDVFDNSYENLGYLITRFGDGSVVKTIRSIVGNNVNNRIVIADDMTITNLINNTYKVSKTFGSVTVTNDHGNVLML